MACMKRPHRRRSLISSSRLRIAMLLLLLLVVVVTLAMSSPVYKRSVTEQHMPTTGKLRPKCEHAMRLGSNDGNWTFRTRDSSALRHFGTVRWVRSVRIFRHQYRSVQKTLLTRDVHKNGIPIPVGFPREFHGSGNTNVPKMGIGMGRVHVTVGMGMATF